MSKQRDITSIVEDMTMRELVKFAKVSLTITGAENIAEMYLMIDSRFNNIEGNKLNAVPLRQWCIDENLNYKEVFKTLNKKGYIDSRNRVQEPLIHYLYTAEEGDEALVKMEDIILFNTNRQGKTVLMIRPESLVKTQFMSLFSGLNSYQGSKGMTAKQMKKANKSIAHLIDWTE